MSSGRTRRQRDQSIGASSALEHVLLGFLPAFITGLVVYQVYRNGSAAVDSGTRSGRPDGEPSTGWILTPGAGTRSWVACRFRIRRPWRWC